MTMKRTGGLADLFMIVVFVAWTYAVCTSAGCTSDNIANDAPDGGAVVVDAPTYPLCSSILASCADLATISRVCASTGECYCDPDGRGPEPRIRCTLDAH